ncbi:MAG: DUF1828 domain-containing protein [Thermoanaerobaculia bacterium]
MPSDKLTIKRAALQLTTAIPGKQYTILPDIRPNRVWAKLGIKTPFFYPDGERIWVYLEIADGKKGLIRLHDDGLTQDHIAYRDLNGTLRKHRVAIRKAALDSAGVWFTRTRDTDLQISTTCAIGDVAERIPILAGAMSAVVEECIAIKARTPDHEPLIERIIARLFWKPEFGVPVTAPC